MSERLKKVLLNVDVVVRDLNLNILNVLILILHFVLQRILLRLPQLASIFKLEKTIKL